LQDFGKRSAIDAGFDKDQRVVIPIFIAVGGVVLGKQAGKGEVFKTRDVDVLDGQIDRGRPAFAIQILGTEKRQSALTGEFNKIADVGPVDPREIIPRSIAEFGNAGRVACGIAVGLKIFAENSRHRFGPNTLRTLRSQTMMLVK